MPSRLGPNGILTRVSGAQNGYPSMVGAGLNRSRDQRKVAGLWVPELKTHDRYRSVVILHLRLAFLVLKFLYGLPLCHVAHS